MGTSKQDKHQTVSRVMGEVLIQHRAFRKTLRRFDECRTSFMGGGEPICMLVHGPAGVGKSTLALSYLADHPPQFTDDRKLVPILNAIIPVPATMKNMASELLDKLGDPLSDRGTLEQRTKRLRRLLKECGTELIVLDEFQHFIDRKSERVIADVSDWLKNLISNTSIPVVLVGLPYSRGVLAANEQLMRRFSYQVELPPFSWTQSGPREEFCKILEAIDGELASVLGERSELKDYAERCHAATKGLIALIVKLLTGAAQEVVAAGATRIEQKHLARAYRERLVPDPNAPNPFLPDWSGEKFDPLPETRHLQGDGTIPMRKSRRKSPALGAVLSAR